MKLAFRDIQSSLPKKITSVIEAKRKKNVQLTTNAATVGKTATSLITKQLIKRQQKWK